MYSQIEKSSKGKDVLFIEGQTFYKNKSLNGKSYWSCSLYKSIKCPSRAITSGEKLLSFHPHNHSLTKDSGIQHNRQSVDNNALSPHPNKDNFDEVRDVIKQKRALLTSKSDNISENDMNKEIKTGVVNSQKHQIDSSKLADMPIGPGYFRSNSQSLSRDSSSMFDDFPSTSNGSQSIYIDSQSRTDNSQSKFGDSESTDCGSQSRDSGSQSKFSDSQPPSVSSQSKFSDSSSRSDESQSSNVDTRSSSIVDGSECDTPDCIEYRPFGCSDDEEKLFSKYSPIENKKRKKIELEDDPNILVDRLRVVMSKIQRGDLSYTGEMSSIIGALKKGGYIH